VEVEVPKEEPAKEEKAADSEEAPAESEEAPAESEATPMQTDDAPKEPEKEKKRKKKIKKTPLKVECTTWSLNKEGMETSIQQLLDLEMNDKLICDTLDRKNAVESYVYETRDAVDMNLREYISDEDRSTFMAALNAAEDWLYGDGEYGSKSDYVNKLKELKVMGDPVELRFKEQEKRAPAIEALSKAISDALAFVASEEEIYAHIEAEERAKVKTAADSAQKWLDENNSAQAAKSKTEAPAFLASAVEAQTSPVLKVLRDVSSKPKPKPKEEPKAEEAAPEGEEAPAADEEAPADEVPADSADMDVD